MNGIPKGGHIDPTQYNLMGREETKGSKVLLRPLEDSEHYLEIDRRDVVLDDESTDSKMHHLHYLKVNPSAKIKIHHAHKTKAAQKYLQGDIEELTMDTIATLEAVSPVPESDPKICGH